MAGGEDRRGLESCCTDCTCRDIDYWHLLLTSGQHPLATLHGIFTRSGLILRNDLGLVRSLRGGSHENLLQCAGHGTNPKCPDGIMEKARHLVGCV